jgi:hypothetical protein
MGFTHYVDGHVAFTTDQWATFIRLCQQIFENTKVPLAGWDGAAGTKPVVNFERVSFNGVEDDAHETCVILRRAESFTFCKTAHMPYDSVVVAVYKAVRDILPDTVLSSDGGDEVFD